MILILYFISHLDNQSLENWDMDNRGNTVQMESSTSWVQVKASQQSRTARKSVKFTKNSKVYAQHYSVNKDQFFPKTTSSCIAHKQLYLIQLTHQTIFWYFSSICKIWSSNSFEEIINSRTSEFITTKKKTCLL